MIATPVRGMTLTMNDSRRTIMIAALLIAVATVLGAFGTHALKPVLPPARFDSFETGVSYQFFHSLGLLALGLLRRDSAWGGAALRWACRLLLVGMLLFSGSIYALTFGGPRALGMVAPLGGLSFMGAWVLVAWAAWQGGKGAAASR